MWSSETNKRKLSSSNNFFSLLFVIAYDAIFKFMWLSRPQIWITRLIQLNSIWCTLTLYYICVSASCRTHDTWSIVCIQKHHSTTYWNLHAFVERKQIESATHKRVRSTFWISGRTSEIKTIRFFISWKVFEMDKLNVELNIAWKRPNFALKEKLCHRTK